MSARQRLLLYREVAELLSAPEATVRQLVRRGAIPFIRLSGALVRFDEAEIRRWIDERRNLPANRHERSRARLVAVGGGGSEE